MLDRDIKYEIAQDTTIHHLKTKTNVYSLRLSQDSNGKEFALVVQTIIRSIQGKDECHSYSWPYIDARENNDFQY